MTGSNEITQVQPPARLSLWARFVRFAVRLLIAASALELLLVLCFGHAQGSFASFMLGAGLVIFSLWLCLLMLFVFLFVWRASQVAFTPIPGPAEIKTQLRAYLGRQPTLEEMNAAQQMIKTRRNEALLGLGAVFGGLYLGGHVFKGR